MKFTKPTLYFVSLNVLRLLSVVAICLVFAGEIFTINADIKGMHAVQSAAATPSTTASTRIVRRSALPIAPSPEAPAAEPTGPAPTSQRFEKVHRRLQRRLEAEHALVKREPVESGSSLIGDDGDTASSARAASATRTTKGAKTTSSPSTAARVTATNAPTASAEGGCTYVGSTSIPKGAGGALFSTLERIFAAFILLLALVSELPPPFAPLSPPAVLLERFWTAFFPPFGAEYGVGVLGAVQVFVGAQVLSHYTTGWVQVSAWLLFLIGILNLLFGLALGARLKVLRSLSQDSTTPSALRKLRLQREAHSAQWEEFDRDAPSAPAQAKRRSFLPAAFRRTPAADDARPAAAAAAEKRSRSRNGPNGIVIGAPMAMKRSAEGPVVTHPPPVYQDGRE